MKFPVDNASIQQRLEKIDPIQYAKTRNFIDGDVTCLSPYISRGVLTLPEVRDAVLKKGYKPGQVEKLLQELGWREFFQRVWLSKGAGIFNDLKQSQQHVAHYEMIASVEKACTGVEAIDRQIKNLYEFGYLHNHVRMYLAGITCNMGKAHWYEPSRWMYYYLLDGDLASNALSWQWVAGSFSNKKYIANQENINRYLKSNQRDTFLDHSYETIFDQPIPPVLKKTVKPDFITNLPQTNNQLTITMDEDVCIYTSYWLNPNWRVEEKYNRILLLEPCHFQKFPVSEKVLHFIIELAKEHIKGIQLFVGEFHELQAQLQPGQKIFYMDHPLHRSFKGWPDPYPWMFPQVTGSFHSFFAFWKKAERYL